MHTRPRRPDCSARIGHSAAPARVPPTGPENSVCDRVATGLLGRDDPPARLHHAHRHAQADVGETPLELGEVLVEQRGDVGRHDRRARPLELAPFRRHLVRGDDDRVGELRPQRLDDAPLVGGVDVRVQQAHRHGVVATAQALGELLDFDGVERDKRLTGGVESLVQLEHVPPADQRGGRPVADVIHRRTVGPTDLVDVPEAGGRHQRHAAAASLEQGVDPGRRAVDEGADLVEGDPEPADRIDHAVGQPPRRRQRFGGEDGAVRAGGDGVGERAADVDGEPVARPGNCD